MVGGGGGWRPREFMKSEEAHVVAKGSSYKGVSQEKEIHIVAKYSKTVFTKSP